MKALCLSISGCLHLLLINIHLGFHLFLMGFHFFLAGSYFDFYFFLNGQQALSLTPFL